jgi:hypothetical protein
MRSHKETSVQSTIRPTRRDEVASEVHAEERGNRAQQLSLVRTLYSFPEKIPRRKTEIPVLCGLSGAQSVFEIRRVLSTSHREDDFDIAREKYFNTLDMESGFHHLKLAEQDKEKTAFSTSFGSFQWKRLHFGLANSPSSFQRLMDVVLTDLKGLEYYIFLYDVFCSQTLWKSTPSEWSTSSRGSRKLTCCYNRPSVSS